MYIFLEVARLISPPKYIFPAMPTPPANCPDPVVVEVEAVVSVVFRMPLPVMVVAVNAPLNVPGPLL